MKVDDDGKHMIKTQSSRNNDKLFRLGNLCKITHLLDYVKAIDKIH